MAETRKSTRTTTVVIPEKRKSNPNPTGNSTMDPIHGHVWTARTWTLLGISFKLLALCVILIFVIALPHGLENSGGARRSLLLTLAAAKAKVNANISANVSAEAPSKSTEFLPTAAFFWSLPLLILYGVALVGAVKEKTILIAFYCVWLFVEGAVALALLAWEFLRKKRFMDPLDFNPTPFSAWAIFNVMAFGCATEFMKQVESRKSKGLESKIRTNKFCSA